MKYFYKFFLSMILVLTVALAVVEYYSVALSLDNSFQRELSSGLAQHQLIKHTVQASILNAGSGGTVSEAELSAVGKSAAGFLKTGGSLMLCGGTDKTYYSGLSSVPDLTDVQDGNLSYSVEKGERGAVSLLVESKFTQSGRELYLVTKQDISPVFSEADALRGRCTRLYFIVLGACAAVALGLAYTLAKPLTVLRRASRAFGNGDYSSRASICSKDEIGELAQDYNKMADTIEEKISKLEEAARRQERFTANFAHELKTPMTSIIGYADTIYQKSLSPEETRQAAWYIMNEGMRLEALSFKLMDLFAVNNEPYTLEETEITTVLKDVGATVTPLAEKRGIKFTFHAEEGWVRLEYDLFKTLLLNLIDNALKSGGNNVSLAGTKENGFYCIAVADNGRGIPESELKRISEAFYMVDKSRSRKEHGAGLGLALCAKIAEIHGTNLQYASVPGNGTTVSFTLKMEAASDER